MLLHPKVVRNSIQKVSKTNITKYAVSSISLSQIKIGEENRQEIQVLRNHNRRCEDLHEVSFDFHFDSRHAGSDSWIGPQSLNKSRTVSPFFAEIGNDGKSEVIMAASAEFKSQERVPCYNRCQHGYSTEC